jgi:hypothetical protein
LPSRQVGRDAAVLEQDLRGVGRALAHLLLDAGDDVAGRLGRHQEARDALLAGRLVGDREDDRHLGVLAGGDELLDAVEDEIVAVALGAGGDRRRVGTGVRLGEAEAAEHLAARQRLEPGFLLLVVAVFQ